MMCTTSINETLAKLLLLGKISGSHWLFSCIGLVRAEIGLVWLLVNMLVEVRIGSSSTLRWHGGYRSWLRI